MPIPLNILVYEKTANGVPGTTLVDDLCDNADGYQHTITDQFGFESMQVALKVSLDEATDWLANGLGRSVLVTGPDAETCWEGQLTTVSAQIGQETRSVSLDGMANRVRCVYTTVYGTAGTINSISDTDSQFLYGIKDAVLSANNSDNGEAGYYAAVELARRANPVMTPTTNVMTGDQGDSTLTLSFTGWYGVLDWLVTSNTATSKAVTTTQIGTLLTAYVAVNAFLSASTIYITASGISATQLIADNTTYREKIEELLKKGTGTNPLTWGVYEDRLFRVDPWAGATPDTITYQRYLGDSNVYNSSGGVVAPWNVRPNAMYQTADLLDVGPPASAPDAASRFYVARTTCTVSGNQIGVTLEPEQPQDLSAILIRKY